MDYSVLESYSALDLGKQVEAALNAGWKPLGGASVSVGGNNIARFVQAMTRGD